MKKIRIPENILEKIAEKEMIEKNVLSGKISEGRVVVPLNRKRQGLEKPCAIGEGLSVKVNANIGGSPDISDPAAELEKLRTSVKYGTDTVMDLTIGKYWKRILSAVVRESPVPVGTVPVYGAVCLGGSVADLKSDDFIEVISTQAEMGVDFMTVHAGVTRSVSKIYDKSKRVGGMVSRGGKIIYRWMKENNMENPLYERFDEILDIASQYNITISLGDGLRPGCLADASDDAQYGELRVLGELSRRCRQAGVQVMIEGPGHVPLNLIEENVRMEKELCGGAPFYVLGPLTTDIGAGYDHITGAIGGAFAAWKGADFLCYLTPAEHLHLPDNEDVAMGVIASKIAAHSGDVAKKIPGALERNEKMSKARRDLDWELMQRNAMAPAAVERERKRYPERKDRACTMCGEYCALLD